MPVFIALHINEVLYKFLIIMKSLNTLVLTAISRWTWGSRYQNVSILDYRSWWWDYGDGGDNWSYRTCKATYRHHQQTNTWRMSFLSPNQQCQSTKASTKSNYSAHVNCY